MKEIDLPKINVCIKLNQVEKQWSIYNINNFLFTN